MDDVGRLTAVLTDLYREVLAANPTDEYVRSHSRPRVVEHQVRTFRWYVPYLPATGRILDWGCNHQPDGCLLRAEFGDRYEQHACDVGHSGRFPAFESFARSEYRRLDHPVRLPYDDATFGAVIASGVLEHTAQDYESLKELYRILEPGGIVAVSSLPNRRSAGEWWLRTRRRPGAHLRRYGLGEAKTLFLRAGFVPVVAEISFRGWERLGHAVGLGRFAESLSKAGRTLVPVHTFASTLRFILRKVIAL